jgi:hypothetical protein
VESNKFQIWANAGGDVAKREREFLGGRRVEESSLFGRSSHGRELRGDGLRSKYLGEKGERQFWWAGVYT